MILSFWRRAHLILALVASTFLIITSVTGVILSFAPISSELSDNHIKKAAEMSVGKLITILEKNYLEVIEVKIGQNEFLEVTVITNDGDFENFYANPKTGEKLSNIEEESPIFTFSRTLHRSLFLGELGRVTIGITAFLLLLISLSGAVLVIKRQLSIKRFFSKVIRDNFYHYWHIILGRTSLFIIVIISLTGTFLSMSRFGLIPEKVAIKHTFEASEMRESPQKPKRDFTIFKDTKLDQLEELQFPFSPDPEDYFLLRLHQKELIVNQFNGEIISEKSLGSTHWFEQLSFNLHTGKGSILWSIILGLASISILFFIFSGFKITLKRIRGKATNVFSKDNSEIIMLVGSEGGNTLRLAKQFQQLLIESGQKVFLTEMNHYESYPRMQQLIVFTSTHGNGEAPTNAQKFIGKFQSVHQKKSFKFSVVGFGSTDYLQFCKYAEIVQEELSKSSSSEALLPLFKINKGSFDELTAWIEQWSKASEIQLNSELERPIIKSTLDLEEFEIIGKTIASEESNFTFLLTLKTNNDSFKSGDLIAIQLSTSDDEERFYSIGVNADGHILLCIRKHLHGHCSTFLSELELGSKIMGRIQSNPSFNLPGEQSKIIGISNGTGIAPFLGMGHENSSGSDIQLYWGGKSRSVLATFEPHLNELTSNGKIQSFSSVFSDENGEESRYVQSILHEKAKEIAEQMNHNALIMICGSIQMRTDVLNTLDTLLRVHNNKSISYYEKKGQIKTDCY